MTRLLLVSLILVVSMVSPALAGLQVTYEHYGTNPITFNVVNLGGTSNTYLWEFGDGSFSKQETVIHSFEKPGSYRVTLKSDTAGEYSSHTETMVVTEGYSQPLNKPSAVYPTETSIPIQIASVMMAPRLVPTIKPQITYSTIVTPTFEPIVFVTEVPTPTKIELPDVIELTPLPTVEPLITQDIINEDRDVPSLSPMDFVWNFFNNVVGGWLR